jgi:hypothetical protein
MLLLYDTSQFNLSLFTSFKRVSYIALEHIVTYVLFRFTTYPFWLPTCATHPSLLFTVNLISASVIALYLATAYSVNLRFIPAYFVPCTASLVTLVLHKASLLNLSLSNSFWLALSLDKVSQINWVLLQGLFKHHNASLFLFLYISF